MNTLSLGQKPPRRWRNQPRGSNASKSTEVSDRRKTTVIAEPKEAKAGLGEKVVIFLEGCREVDYETRKRCAYPEDCVVRVKFKSDLRISKNRTCWDEKCGDDNWVRAWYIPSDYVFAEDRASPARHFFNLNTHKIWAGEFASEFYPPPTWLIEVQDCDLPYLERPEGCWEFRKVEVGDDFLVCRRNDAKKECLHGGIATNVTAGLIPTVKKILSGYRWCRPRTGTAAGGPLPDYKKGDMISQEVRYRKWWCPWKVFVKEVLYTYVGADVSGAEEVACFTKF